MKQIDVQGNVADATAGAMPSRLAAVVGPPVSTPQVTIDGMEVVQVIQSLGQTVLLVARKQTLVRVYVSASGTSAVSIRGTLAIQRDDMNGSTVVSSMTSVVVDPAKNGSAGLQQKREDLALSLNFRIPTTLLNPGNVKLHLVGLETVNPAGTISVPVGATKSVTFLQDVPLRIRVIGLRYHSPSISPNPFEPAPIDYALIQSWLGRAYPVANVEWSQTVVDWPGTPEWPTSEDDLGEWGRDFVNPFLSTLRQQDVAAGTDERTHFFGLAADGGGFMRGWASFIPVSPDPSAVASGPAGATGFPWDIDGSYADWYTGHELAHTFGRFHPGFCPGNSADDSSFPYPNGQIAHDDGDFVGFDCGDQNHMIPAKALPGIQWHDLMTYCSFQWLSAYTYEGIYHRLVDENALTVANPVPAALQPVTPQSTTPKPITGGGAMLQDFNGIHLVARVNQSKGTGKFCFVTPVALPRPTSAAASQSNDFAVRAKKVGGTVSEYSAPFRHDACGDPTDNDIKGSIDFIIPNDDLIVELELVHNGNTLATYTQGAEPPNPKDIRPASAGTVAALSAMTPHLASPRPKISWTSDPVVPGPGAALVAAAAISVSAGSRVSHTVQLSNDNGQTWRTIGVGLTSPEVSLDPQLLIGKDSIQIRVITTNGFRAKSVTQNMSVKDL